MRKLIVVVAPSGLLIALTGLALGAAGTSFHGSGRVYSNNGRHFNRGPSERISFRVSADRSHVLAFKGYYVYYCGAGTSTITAGSLRISHGHFGGTGKRANKNGINYFALGGTFSRSGRSATIVYMDDFVYKGKHVSDPYSFAYHRPALACQTVVRGSVSS